ncbi:MAG: TrkA family potassium uptake protein [Actinobacteria bacterium]|nr:TrkA family potassium uptake protein [Actinomycetota bacterium]MBL7060372.1 TrkA family potassium uptake protein [Actinomycetota bacterium]
MKKQFLVIGLGRFGISVARTLTEAGHTVVGMDQSENRIQRISEEITDVIKCDATDSDILDSIGIPDFEAVIVCIGEKYIQNSTLVTLILKEKGAKKIIAKAGTKTQGRVLSKVGADTIVFPEKDMGERVAKSLISSNVIDFLEVSPEVSIVEMITPNVMIGKTLIELNLRNKYGVTIISIKNNENGIKAPPDINYRFKKDDILTLIGENKKLKKLKFTNN